MHSVHGTLGYQSNASSLPVKLAVKKLSRAHEVFQQQASGMTEELLHRLLHATDSTKKGFRDRALLRLAYESMRYRDELVQFRVSDLDIRADGICILVLPFFQ